MEEKVNDFYNKNIDEIRNFEKEEKAKNLKSMKIALIVLVSLLVVLFVIYFSVDSKFNSFLVAIYIISFLSVAIFSIIMFFSSTRKNVNRKIIEYILEDITKDEKIIYDETGKSIMSEIEDLDLLDLSKEKIEPKNYYSLNYNLNKTAFCDIEIYHEEKKEVEKNKESEDDTKPDEPTYTIEKKIDFLGMVIIGNFGKDIKEKVYVISKDLFKQNILKSKDCFNEEIELENIDITKKYKVFSNNEIIARYILTPSYMEKINSLDEIDSSNGKTIVFNTNGKVAIFIPGKTIGNTINKKIKLNKEENAKEKISQSYNEVAQIFNYLDTLNLGND